MALKASKKVIGAVAGGIVAVLVAASLIFGATRNPGPADDTGPPMQLGPDMGQTQPGGAPPQFADAGTPPAPPDPSVATASAPDASSRPGAVAFSDESLVFAAALPMAAADDPVLAYLHKDAERYLARIKINARADHDRLKREGVKAAPWEVKVAWAYTAKAGDIVSLAGEASEYAGGAHPVLYFDTHIARADTGEEIDFADLLILKRSPSPALTIAICEGLKSAKVARIKSATIFDEPIVCAGPDANAKSEAAALALAPSDQVGKFGGVYAYYAPYAVGAHSEGPYKLTIQQSVFAEDLRSDVKFLFAGQAPQLADRD